MNDGDTDEYYRDATSWAHDRRDTLRRSRQLAWIVASAAITIAILEAFALMLLIPLKTVVPYTLLVDRQTGFVQALKPLDDDRLSGERALTQSFLVQYVIARESFDIATLQDEYRKVVLWSASGARAAYIAAMQAGDPRSPLNRFPRTTVVTTRVKSVSSLGNGTALVRFATERHDGNGPGRPLGDWVAVIGYRYVDTPMQAGDRFVNPLGFEVIRYRRDAETLPTARAAADGDDI